MRTTRLFAGGAAGLALVLGACSSSSKPSSAVSTATPGNTAASRPATTAPPTTTAQAAESSPPGDIPDNQVFVAYTPPGGRFTVKVPEGWARVSNGGTVTFTDKLNSVRIQAVPSGSAPTVASATRTEVPAIQASSRNFQAGTVSSVQRAAGSAVRITYRVDSSPDPVTGKVVRDAVERYEFWDPGTRTEAVLTLSGPVGADNVDPWRTVTDSLRWR